MYKFGKYNLNTNEKNGTLGHETDKIIRSLKLKILASGMNQEKRLPEKITFKNI